MCVCVYRELGVSRQFQPICYSCCFAALARGLLWYGQPIKNSRRNNTEPRAAQQAEERPRFHPLQGVGGESLDDDETGGEIGRDRKGGGTVVAVGRPFRLLTFHPVQFDRARAYCYSTSQPLKAVKLTIIVGFNDARAFDYGWSPPLPFQESWRYGKSVLINGGRTESVVFFQLDFFRF